LFTQILLPRYLMNGLNNLNKTYGEYSLAATDDLIRLWRSKVKVTAGHQDGEGIQVDTSQGLHSGFKLDVCTVHVTYTRHTYGLIFHDHMSIRLSHSTVLSKLLNYIKHSMSYGSLGFLFLSYQKRVRNTPGMGQIVAVCWR